MKMHSVAAVAAVFAVLGAAPALAAEGNPMVGVGVSVEQSPGGLIMKSADCKAPKGTLQQVGGKWVCKLTPVITTTTMTPTKPLTTLKPTVQPAGH